MGFLCEAGDYTYQNAPFTGARFLSLQNIQFCFRKNRAVYRVSYYGYWGDWMEFTLTAFTL